MRIGSRKSTGNRSVFVWRESEGVFQERGKTGPG